MERKPYYRTILDSRLVNGEILTTKRGGGSKLRPTDCTTFKKGDLCLIQNNRAYPLELPLAEAPEVLTVK